MSEPSARKYVRSGMLPSATRKSHTWRTREDCFEAVWPQLHTLLEANPGLEAKTLFDYLQRQHPGRFQDGQLRTDRAEFTERYTGLMKHYGISFRCIGTAKPNENGCVEQRHHRFKRGACGAHSAARVTCGL